MKIKSLISETPDYLRLGLGILGFVVCFLLAVPELDGHSYFLSPLGMIVVAWQVSPFAFWLRFRANIPIGKTVLVTAIPAGIVGTTMGFQAVTSSTGLPSFSGLASVGDGASTMSLTIVYGGSLALVAYAFGGEDDFKISAVDLATVLPCIGFIVPIYFGLWLNVSNDAVTFSDY